MAGYYSVWRFSRTTLAILLATACNAQLALGQYTRVQDSDGVGDWSDAANWLDGGSNTTFPNGIGVTALINQPIKSGVGGYTLDMPATDVTVGTLTIDNTNDQYATKITMFNHNGRLVFEDPSGTAKYIETTNGTTTDAPQSVQNSIQMPILVKNTLEITQQNYPNLNTGTTFTNRFDGDINSVIVKKGIGGIQFNLNSAPGAGFGFLGQFQIQEGTLRLINNTYSIAQSSGMTVSSGGQLQLADNATAVPDFNLATGAVLNLNGTGKANAQAGPEGALRFGVTVAGRTATFHNPVNLQSDARIYVALANTIGKLDSPVSGGGDLIKAGPGQLSLTGSNTYTGDTQINAGILSIATATLADTADVTLSTGAKFNLNFSGSDTIRSLYFGVAPQPIGTYGATGSGATNINDTFFTGTGVLNVTTAPVVGVPGDFNGNGTVDAADYVLWRKGGPLQNEIDTPGTVNGQDYLDWRSQFGKPPGSGSSLSAAAVPEPSTLMLLVFIAPLFVSGKLRRKRS
jgi:autotransporter-associated beta strand protein